MAQSHPIEQLLAHLPDSRPHGGGMVEIDHHLPGLGFFPGGDGLWKVPGRRRGPHPDRVAMLEDLTGGDSDPLVPGPPPGRGYPWNR